METIEKKENGAILNQSHFQNQSQNQEPKHDATMHGSK